MAEPITLTCSILSIASALAIRVGIYIAEIQNASDEFKGILIQVRQLEKTLTKLSRVFKATTIPGNLVEEYTRDLRLHQNELEDIAAVLKEVTSNLHNKSMFSKLWQKNSLANGEITRLNHRLQFFNQNLTNMLLMHNCNLTTEIHTNVVNTRRAVTEVSRGVRLDLGVRYGPAAVRAIQQDPWEDERDCGPVQRPEISGRWAGWSGYTPPSSSSASQRIPEQGWVGGRGYPPSPPPPPPTYTPNVSNPGSRFAGESAGPDLGLYPVPAYSGPAPRRTVSTSQLQRPGFTDRERLRELQRVDEF